MAEDATAALVDRYPGATPAAPVSAEFRRSAGKLIVARFAQRLVPRLRRAQFPQGSMSNTITYLVGACCGVLGLAAFCALVVVPASRPIGGVHERMAVSCSRYTSWPPSSGSACCSAR